MQEALQKERVIEQLQNNGYKPGIFVYGTAEAASSYILNFTEKGIVFLALNVTCSGYISHSFLAIENIKAITFKKGIFLYTLTIFTADGIKHKLTIPSRALGVGWQKDNVIQAQEFLQEYFQQRQGIPVKKI